MNPPSALHSAMGRDRKPFTYTPGGINLSEIKSQRMAQRLMRNAMNPGVPEIPVHPVLPSATPTTPIALPNYNCLPVQVFPAMPANPKSLLRSRSNPDPRDTSIYKPIQPTPINNVRFEDNDIMNSKNSLAYALPTNNDRRVSLNEYTTASKDYSEPNLSYGNDRYTIPSNTNLYASPYKSAFVYAPVAAPMPSQDSALLGSATISPTVTLASDSTPVYPENSIEPVFELYNAPVPEQFSELKISEKKDNNSVESTDNQTVDSIQDIVVNPFEDVNVNLITEEAPRIVTKFVGENADIDNEQREVKVVKKQVTKENKVQEQNGNQNGDTNEEAEMTVKLPTKKSGAKTETKVEVERKTLPDGTIEEIKTTTTKTTIDGRTEIKTRTETTIIPKDEESEEEIEEEEEEVEDLTEKAKEENDTQNTETITLIEKAPVPKENGSISKTEERSETTIIKKVALVQESPKPEESEVVDQDEECEEEEGLEEGEEVEEVEEAEPVTVVLKKQASPEPKVESKPVEEEKDENESEEEVVEEPEDKEEEKVEINVKEEKVEEKEESEPEEEEKESTNKDDDEEYEEVEEEKQEVEVEQKTEIVKATEKDEGDSIKKSTEEEKEDTIPVEVSSKANEPAEEKEHVIPVQVQESEEPQIKIKEDKPEEKPAEFTIPIREPSIPLDKVEDIEIKPIGITPIITKTHTENTEIIRSTIDPSGGLSKQTEYNKIENIVTVNRTTKILDQNYETLTQQGIPTVKTYFPPPSIERFSASPMPSRPYQPVYPPEPVPERRHSLLLERLSMERQMPSDIYQYSSNQSYNETQYQNEPQSEVLTVSNVKPSTITNQQWYTNQQTKQTQNVLYNNVTSNPTNTGIPFAQTQSLQPQQPFQPSQQYQPQPQPQYQAQYQPPTPPQFQRGTTPQPQLQRGTTPQPQFQKAAAPQPQYQPSYTEPLRDRTPVNNYSSYTPNPTWVSSTVESSPSQYSYLNKDSTQSYQKSTLNTSTQYSTGYVPPPWEQDSSYTSVNNTSEKYYQEVPPPNAFSPTPSQGWKPTPASVKFTKPTPIAYAPPAPNQSFVKPVVEVPRHPGRKTYYSEYERRYITVPESTYIPTETKFQPQPDPSPQYYYDNNEPSEPVEPQWRKELREFTEKTSQTQTVEETNIQPPWEVDPKYVKTPPSTYNPTPTWSQTLRPQSNRERSFEAELVSQEWPKSNTLGRRRPLSTIGVSTEGKITDRVRGVSVDRYNPNSYQAPAEHPPVQTHTLVTPVHAGYHNPNVPAYHTRASAEPREQPIPYQQRVYREARASPLQSRSFKYLQWITGTEN